MYDPIFLPLGSAAGRGMKIAYSSRFAPLMALQAGWPPTRIGQPSVCGVVQVDKTMSWLVYWLVGPGTIFNRFA